MIQKRPSHRDVAWSDLVLDCGHALVVAIGPAEGHLNGRFTPVEVVQHAFDHASIDRADDRVLDRHIAERAMVGDDGGRFAVVLGMGAESVSR